MKIKYIVKSESQGTYLTHATDVEQQYIPNQIYTFRSCDLNHDVIKFDSKEEAISAYEKILKNHSDVYDPVIFETIVSE